VDNDRIKIRRDIRKMKKIKVVWLDKAWTSLIKAQILSLKIMQMKFIKFLSKD
jgi:hypothetical protein